MTVWGEIPPDIYVSGLGNEEDPLAYNITNGQTIYQGDIVILENTGLISRGASDAHANIAGMAKSNGTSMYYTSNPAAVPAPRFGFSNSQQLLAPAGNNEITGIYVARLDQPTLLVLTILQPMAIDLVGTSFGFLLDTTFNANGIFIADNTQADKPLTLERYVSGPLNFSTPLPQYAGPSLGFPAIGDTYVRGIFSVSAAALAN